MFWSPGVLFPGKFSAAKENLSQSGKFTKQTSLIHYKVFYELDSSPISRGNAEVPQKQNLLHTPCPAHSEN